MNQQTVKANLLKLIKDVSKAKGVHPKLVSELGSISNRFFPTNRGKVMPYVNPDRFGPDAGTKDKLHRNVWQGPDVSQDVETKVVTHAESDPVGDTAGTPEAPADTPAKKKPVVEKEPAPPTDPDTGLPFGYGDEPVYSEDNVTIETLKEKGAEWALSAIFGNDLASFKKWANEELDARLAMNGRRKKTVEAFDKFLETADG